MNTLASRLRIGRGLPWDGASLVALGLYGLTLALEGMLGGMARWLLATVVLWVAALGAPIDPYVDPLALAAGAGPLVWSVVAVLRPGAGRAWAGRLGARELVQEERDQLEAALGALGSEGDELEVPATVYAVDDVRHWSMVQGGALVVSRGLLVSGELAPVLAHELAHVESLDGRVTEALARLALWGDSAAEEPVDERPRMDMQPSGGLLWRVLRLWLRTAGVAMGVRLLAPVWAAYWRRREYAADARAAELGQAIDLARYLRERELPLDVPQPRSLLNRAEHPPVALRIERLERAAEVE